MSGRARWIRPRPVPKNGRLPTRAVPLFLNTSRHIPGTGSCAPARRDVDRVLPPLARSCRRVLPRKRICSPDVAIQLSAADRPIRKRAKALPQRRIDGRARGLSGGKGYRRQRGTLSDAEGAPLRRCLPERKKANASFGMHPLLSLWGGCRRALPAPRPGILVRAAPNRRGVSSQ